MSQWTDRPLQTARLAFFDLETTGLRPDRGGRICEIAVVDHDGVQMNWVSEDDPPSDERVAHQLPRVLEALADRVVVGHNLQFDFRFLTYEAERLDHPGFDVQFVDTLGLARRLLPHRNGYQLDVLVRDVEREPDEELHTAVGDALATRALFWHLVEEDGCETLADVGVQRLRWHGG